MVIYSGFTHWKWWFSIAMLVYQRVNHINLAEELSEINRNTPFGAALWGNGRSRATIINQYMQGYVVCLVSKCIPKPWCIIIFPINGHYMGYSAWDSLVPSGMDKAIYHPMVISPHQYNQLYTRTLHWYTSLKTGIIPIFDSLSLFSLWKWQGIGISPNFTHLLQYPLVI